MRKILKAAMMKYPIIGINVSDVKIKRSDHHWRENAYLPSMYRSAKILGILFSLFIDKITCTQHLANVKLTTSHSRQKPNDLIKLMTVLCWFELYSDTHHTQCLSSVHISNNGCVCATSSYIFAKKPTGLLTLDGTKIE